MQPGPTIIKICSECSGLIAEDTIISGNTFGATFWTDGKRDAPMLPDQSWFVICPHCQTSIWIDEQEEAGEIEAFSKNEKYKDAKPYRTPILNDYFNQLNIGNLDRNKEQYLRFRAWWAGNDERRKIGATKNELSDEEKVNIEGLYRMLDFSDDNDRIMMAEIKRELGEFDDAEAIIKETFANEFTEAVTIIKELIEKKELFVAEINFEK